MRRSLFARLGLFALLAWFSPTLTAAGPTTTAQACEKTTFERTAFTVCHYNPARETLKLMWQGRDGRPLGSLTAVRAQLGRDAYRAAFAMNAGMYERDQSPLGLFTVAGKTYRPLDRRTGSGNFYLMPNGVFWTDAGGAPHVEATSDFAAQKPHAWQATQSGPLLVDHGVFNPNITPNGTSILVRNGVGVHGREALFVISDEPVSFGRFARLFRDALKCPDALYLDGTVSSLWAPDLDRMDRRDGLGTFAVVLRRRR